MPGQIQFKKISTVAMLVLALLGQTLASYTLLQPPVAQAQFATFNTTVSDIPRDIEQVALAAGERIALNYANQYLQRFVNQLIDKYKIRNYLYYTQTLSDWYLSRYISDKIADPNLKALFNLLNANFVSGQNTGTTGGLNPQNALIPKLKQSIENQYLANGGVDQNQLFNPNSTTSNDNFFAMSLAYVTNNPEFYQQRVYSGFDSAIAGAQAAANLEEGSSNGYKSSRSDGSCDPGATDCSAGDSSSASSGCSITGANANTVTDQQLSDAGNNQQLCESLGGTFGASSNSTTSGGASTTDTVLSAIQNPGAFVQGFADSSINQLFNNAANSNNIYARIGSLLGGFIFDKLQLSGTSGTLTDVPDQYKPDNGADVTYPEVDLDGDGIPDGQAVDGSSNAADVSGPNELTGKDDTCYFGGVASQQYANDPIASGCFESSLSGSTAYFTPLCQAMSTAITGLTQLHNFAQLHGVSSDPVTPTPPGSQWFGGTGNRGENLINTADEGVWLQKTQPVSEDMDQLFNTISNYHITGQQFDADLFAIGEMDNYMKEVVLSLNKDGDLNLDNDSLGNWDNFGGIVNLIALTGSYSTTLQQYANQLGKCDQPNFTAGSQVPLPGVNPGNNKAGSGTGNEVCTPAAGGHGNDPGAPTTIDPTAVNFVNTDGATTVGSWAQQDILTSVTIDQSNMSFDIGAPPTSWFQDLVGGDTDPNFGVVSGWIVVWRGNQWLAYPAANFFLNGQGAQTLQTGSAGLFCIGGPLSDFVPQAGDTYGFMVSTEARNNGFANNPSNPQQRSNIFPLAWPSGITPPTGQ